MELDKVLVFSMCSQRKVKHLKMGSGAARIPCRYSSQSQPYRSTEPRGHFLL